MIQAIRSGLSRLLAAPLAVAVTWMGLPAATGQELEGAVLTAATLIIYGLLHKALDALGINPGDEARPDG